MASLAHLKSEIKRDPRFAAFCVSLLISWFWYIYQQPVNVDGILYLNSAKAFLSGGLKAAYQEFHWPFYSILIALLSRVTSLDLLPAAYVLNALFMALISVSFISIVRTLGANSYIQCIAAFVILFYPNLSHLHYMIVRDFGYYAFILLSLNYLIKFQQRREMRQAIGWSLSVFIAALFRSEGFAFLLLAPCGVLFCSSPALSKRLIDFIKLHAFNILLASLVGIVFIFRSHDIKAYTLVLQNIIQQLLSVHLIYQQHVESLRQHVFIIFGEEFAPAFFWSGVIAIFLVALVSVLNYIYSFLAFYAGKRRLFNVNTNDKRVVISYISINVVILISFITVFLFMTQRYIMPLCLLFMLWVPYGIYDIFRRFPLRFAAVPPWQSVALLAALIYLLVSSSVHIGVDRSYFIEAGRWVQENTAADARVYTNNLRVSYYINRPGMDIKTAFPMGMQQLPVSDLAALDKRRYDYAVIVVLNREVKAAQHQFKRLNLKPVKILSNNRHDKIYILKLSHSRSEYPTQT